LDLSGEEFKRFFPPIVYPLVKQCLCGKRITWEIWPEWVTCCSTYPHSAYVRNIPDLYADQKIRTKDHRPIVGYSGL
jgi:hypothetical protein